MTDVVSVLNAALDERYRIARKLGEGGMAIVYLADDLKHNRQVVIKVFKPEVAEQLGAERFLLEIETAASLNHPHILTVHDSGAVEGLLYYVMPFVEGESLRDRIDREKQLPIDDTLQIAQEVANALSHAHSQGVVHRDIKPENILMYGGHAVIADFGIAKAVSAAGSERLTSTGMAVGTPTYMSPEQASGEDVDARSDIYALGCLVYEMLVGQPPFTGSTVSAVVSQHVAAPPPSASLVRNSVSEQMSAAILKALEKTPADRFVTASDFAKALQGAGTAPSTPGVSPQYVHAAPVRRPSVGIVKVVGVYLLAVAGAFLLLDYMVNRFVLSPHLPIVGVVALLSLLPAVLIYAFQPDRGSVSQWTGLGKIGIPANLAVSVLLLALMFGTRDLGAVTSSVVIEDEDGNAVERVVPKSEFRKRLIFFYFDSEDADSRNDWYSFGIPGALELDLSQDLFFQVTSPERFASEFVERGFPNAVGVPLTLKRGLADEAHVPMFVSGSYRSYGDSLAVTVQLYDTDRGRLLAERTFLGTNLFEVVDRVSVQLKRDLDLPAQYIEETEDLPVAEIATNSMASFEHFMRGAVALTLRSDWELAESELDQAVALDESNALAHSILYGVAVLGNDREKSAAAIQSAMQHMYRLPERIQFQIKGSYYDFMQQPEKVIAVTKMRVELSPEDLDGRALLARLHKIRSERDEAIAQYEAILEIDPTQYDYLRELGEQHRLNGDFDEAITYQERYAGLFPENSASFVSLGALHRVLGQHEQAKEYFDRALLLDPNNISTLVSLAQLERSFGNFEAEIAQLDDALRRSRTLEDSSVVLGAQRRACSFRGLASGAVEILEMELEVSAEVLATVQYLVTRLMTLDLYVQAGRLEEAEGLYEDVAGELRAPFDKLTSLGRLAISLELDDADAAEPALADLSSFVESFGAGTLLPNVHQAQGRIHELRGEYDSAIESYQAQLEIDRTNMTVLRDIGRCYRKLGDHDRAGEFLEEARRVVSKDPWVLHELALIATEEGDIDTAVSHLESALEVWRNADPGFEAAARARELLETLQAS